MAQVYQIGSRRELFVDEFLIQSTTARLRLHSPVPREICLRFDAPYEGTYNGYPVLLKDGETYRLYYRAGDFISPDGKEFFELKQAAYTCCIESDDGVTWRRPSLGLVEHNGNRNNNIIDNSPSVNASFIPFIDTNPDCPAGERYKAFDYYRKKEGDQVQWGLDAYSSADGYSWTRLFDEQLSMDGRFDSSNLAFWDQTRRTYWAYIRDFHEVPGFARDVGERPDLNKRIRDIRWSQSEDFRNWSKPEPIDFQGAADIPLYVSAVQPYYRAPHFFVGFPKRYVERQSWSPSYDQLPSPDFRKTVMEHHPRYGLALTDCAFMASRDGKTWRRSDEAFLRPGIYHDTGWRYGDGGLTIGMQETASDMPGAPNEISMYLIEHPWHKDKRLRRYTLRQDGFMSLSAGSPRCVTVTRPFAFEGKSLTLNVSTAVIGGMKVELQDAGGRPIDGYTANDCDDIFGDRPDYTVSWNGSSNVAALAGKEIRMKLLMEDADLYSFKFE